MNILHAIPYMHPLGGGPPVVVDRFCRHLQMQGHFASVITTDSLTPANETTAWVEEYRTEYPIRVVPAWYRHRFGYSSTMLAELRRAIEEVDLVHLHNLWSYFTFAVAKTCGMANVPFVISPHGMLDPHSLSRKASKKRFYGQCFEFPRLRRAAGMVYTDQEEQNLAERSCPGLPPGYIVPLGADDPDRDQVKVAAAKLRRRFPEWKDKTLVLFLGRIHPKKGLDLLLPAFDQVRQRCPHAHLVLAGPIADEYRDTLRSTISSYQLGSHITETGIVSGNDKWALYRLAELFVLPSYQENFALTVVESLNMGTPVLLSDRVNIWKQVIEAGAGLRCELKVDSIASNILRIITTPEERERLAAAGPPLVSQQFNWPDSARRLSAAYSTVLAAQSNTFRLSSTLTTF